MKGQQVTEQELLHYMRSMLEGGTVRSVAATIGISPSYLHAVLSGKKPIGRILPAYFGLRPVTVYETLPKIRRKK